MACQLRELRGLCRRGAARRTARARRWTGKDPLRFLAGNTNLYAYLGSDPVNGTDRLGLGPHTMDALERQRWLDLRRQLESELIEKEAERHGVTPDVQRVVVAKNAEGEIEMVGIGGNYIDQTNFLNDAVDVNDPQVRDMIDRGLGGGDLSPLWDPSGQSRELRRRVEGLKESIQQIDEMLGPAAGGMDIPAEVLPGFD